MIHILADIWYSQYGMSNSIKISSILRFELIRSLHEQAVFLILPLKTFLVPLEKLLRNFQGFLKNATISKFSILFYKKVMTMARNGTILMKSCILNLIKGVHVVSLVLSELK